MKITLNLLFFLLCIPQLYSQITLSGTIRDTDTKEPVSYCSVILKNMLTQEILAYTQSNDVGFYALTYHGSLDSAIITVNGLSLTTTIKKTALSTQIFDFEVKSRPIQIKEVVVKADPITRHNDTLSYNVSSFMDQSDRSIGEVLKKMPGITVESSGRITYNGKAINKFYIEGMDMLGGRYGLASNNISAKDVVSVQIMENHQPIKALKDVQISDQAALNLTLQEDIKGTLSANLEAGVGYEPAMWSAEVIAMYFARKYQTLNMYKGNNMGNDVGSDLTSFYEDNTYLNDGMRLSIARPESPPISLYRYLQNNVHILSANNLWKLTPEAELTANLSFKNDLQRELGSASTIFLLPQDSLLSIEEQISAQSKINEGNMDIQLVINADKSYLKNKITMSGLWNRDYGTVLEGGDTVKQGLKQNSYHLSNRFNYILNLDKILFTVHSLNQYSESPSTLKVEPLLYPFILGNNPDIIGLSQNLFTKKFLSETEISTGFKSGNFSHSYRVGFHAQIQNMNSSLNAFSNSVIMSTDSLNNRMNSEKINFFFTPSFTYKSSRGHGLNIHIPLTFVNLNIQDRITQITKPLARIFVEPSVSFTYYLTSMLKLSVSGNYQHNIGGIFDFYRGYIMTDYRMISNRAGDISENKYQNYRLSFSYGNALYSLFISGEIYYWCLHANLLYGTEFIGSLSQIQAYSIPNFAQGYGIHPKISKRFDKIKTTIALEGMYSRNYRDLWRQNELMPGIGDYYKLTLSVNKSFFSKFNASYGIVYDYSSTKVKNDAVYLNPIDALSQYMGLNFFPIKQLNCKLSAEHFFNSTIDKGARSIFFVDASIQYKIKDWELCLEGRNLLNLKIFANATTNDITHYGYTYYLRPRSLIFTVKVLLN